MRFPKHNNKDIAQNYNDIEFCRLIFSGYQRMIQRKKTKFFLLDETKHIFGISGQTGADCN